MIDDDIAEDVGSKIEVIPGAGTSSGGVFIFSCLRERLPVRPVKAVGVYADTFFFPAYSGSSPARSAPGRVKIPPFHQKADKITSRTPCEITGAFHASLISNDNI